MYLELIMIGPIKTRKKKVTALMDGNFTIPLPCLFQINLVVKPVIIRPLVFLAPYDFFLEMPLR